MGRQPAPPADAATPRVSVLLPVRDPMAEALLSCLESLRRQREPRWECWLVDDGSAGGLGPEVEAWLAREPRIRVLRRPRRGLVPALLDGLAACRAPWVARMDADDWMHRDRLAAQLAFLEGHSGLDGVGCHVRLFPRTSLGPGLRSYESWLNAIADEGALRRERFVECPLAHPTWMLRREGLREIPYRDAGWPEDWDLLLRWIAAGRRLSVVPRRLLGWRDHSGRLSRRDPRYGIDRFTECRAEHLCAGPLADHREYVLWGYGGTGRALRRALAARGRTPSHIVELHPRRLGQRIHGAPVVPPEALAGLGGKPLLASVAGLEARSRIRGTLAGLGRTEGVDFFCAA